MSTGKNNLQVSMSDQRLTAISKNDLKKLNHYDLAKRMDDFYLKAHREIYLVDIPSSNFKAMELLGVAAFKDLDETLAREALLTLFEINFNLESTFRAMGDRYVFESPAKQTNGWESPSVQIRANATRLWMTASVRAVLDKFTALIFILEDKQIPSKITSKKLRSKILDAESPFSYFALIVPFQDLLDKTIRTPYLHKRSARTRSMLCMQEVKWENVGPVFYLVNHILGNLWQPLLAIADGKKPSSMAYKPGVLPEDLEKDWLSRHQKEDKDWIRLQLENIKTHGSKLLRSENLDY